MIMQMSPLLVAMLYVAATVASPLGSPRRTILDEPPKLSDTLAVAKSPFEPITLAQIVSVDPNARNDSPSTVSMATTDNKQQQQSKQRLQTTRSTQSLIEQENDTTPVRVNLDEQSSDESPQSTPLSPGGVTETPNPTASAEIESTTGSSEEAEAASTTVSREETATSTTPSPATDITLGTTTTTTTTTPTPTEVTTTDNVGQSGITTAAGSEELPASTNAAPIVEPMKSTEAPARSETETLAPSSVATTDAAPATTTTTPTTAAPAVETTTELEKLGSGEDQAKPVAAVEKDQTSPVAPPEVLAEPEVTTTTGQPQTPATEPPATTTAPVAPTTTITTTSTLVPETSPEPPATTTTTITTTTAKPGAVSEEDKDKKQTEQEASKQQVSSCNHLPTYNADEVQKVFREETTFRNGTIKGKFTYINFDQRYRLVHYTRLPYGPVKIDLVEELGRPEPSSSSNNSTRSPASASPVNEAPNAVLQLRNILPNSLFGFPFFAPNSVANKPLDPRDGASSPGSSFYSTEPLSTPNLLTPNVPLSMLSGRRESSSSVPQTEQPSSPAIMQDTLSQNLNENVVLDAPPSLVAPPVAAGSPSPAIESGTQQPSVSYKQPQSGTTWELPPSPASNLQFQYAMSTQANHLEATRQQLLQNSGPAYTYLAGQPSTQYQYSPLPLYTFQQPSYFSSAHHHHHHHSLPIQATTVAVAATPVASKPASLISHQPHDHEHYIAPFMLSQMPSNSEQQNEPSGTRLKLRVKSAKSLNHNNSGLKSAQLRAQDDASSTSLQQHSSPVQAYRQSGNHGRHRAGKQNQDLRPTINSSPVVYHVLRSPVGRMYSLPQYRNVEAVAYGLDE